MPIPAERNSCSSGIPGMLQNMPPASPNPGACSLPPADRPQRTRDFQALFAGAFVDRVRAPGGVVWRLLYNAATERESRRLADLECRCCDGVTFDVRVADGFVSWEIQAPAEAAALLDVFYEFPVLVTTDEGAGAVWSRLDAHACWRER
jgi:hypothetical protein